MKSQVAYIYLWSPLHTGGASQEGNLVGIAKESHTELPYLPSSTIRGRLRAETPTDEVFLNIKSGHVLESAPEPNSEGSQPQDWKRTTLQSLLWGNTINDVTQGNSDNLTQGTLWLGDAAILWFPVPSLSHGVIWVSSPLLLRRWLRLRGTSDLQLPEVGSFSGGKAHNVYLKDALFKKNSDALKEWKPEEWSKFVPIPANLQDTEAVTEVLVLSDQDCKILVESSLWRQVRVNLDDQKTVVGGFRYEEAIPPETLMYFAWGTTTAIQPTTATFAVQKLSGQLQTQIKQFGGQESLGRGFVKIWTTQTESAIPASSASTIA